MAIKTITVHRVEVEIPWRTYVLFGDGRDFEKAMLEAVGNALESGQDRYVNVIEYAEYSTLPEARAAEAKMNAVVRKFEQMQIEYDSKEEAE